MPGWKKVRDNAQERNNVGDKIFFGEMKNLI